jgi:elongation factor Ts
MAIDAKLVKELRELTGLPMMDCKKALQESGGDVQAAEEALRKQGAKVMEAKAGRTTKEGRVGGFTGAEGRLGVLFAVRCETEPVARCEDFVTFFDGTLEALKTASPPPETADGLVALPHPSGKSVGDALADMVGKIRENIQLGDFTVLRGDAVFQYIHFDNRHGATVVLAGADPADPAIQEVGKNLCMHVVFAKPRFMKREEVPAAESDKEREILLAAAENDPKLAGKPPQIKEKIVEGKMKAFYAQVCLPEQPFVRDEKLTVEKYLKQEGKGATLAAFSYVGLGG